MASSANRGLNTAYSDLGCRQTPFSSANSFQMMILGLYDSEIGRLDQLTSSIRASHCHGKVRVVFVRRSYTDARQIDNLDNQMSFGCWTNAERSLHKTPPSLVIYFTRRRRSLHTLVTTHHLKPGEKNCPCYCPARPSHRSTSHRH
jgi:hypothetical protein